MNFIDVFLKKLSNKNICDLREKYCMYTHMTLLNTAYKIKGKQNVISDNYLFGPHLLWQWQRSKSNRNT